MAEHFSLLMNCADGDGGVNSEELEEMMHELIDDGLARASGEDAAQLIAEFDPDEVSF
jgi:hypothetical protein